MARKQKRLQGHCNRITAIASSNKKRWVVTADSGDDSMLIAWDSYSGIPVRMFLNPHPNGVLKMDLSEGDEYIATLGADLPQTISIWDWTDESRDGPIASLKM